MSIDQATLASRRRIVARLDEAGTSAQQIALQLGISTETARRDLAITRAENVPACPVEGCPNPVRRRSGGWCSTHYSRWLKFGDVQADVPIRDRAPRGSQPCAVDGCTGDRYARGWCSTHYARWQAHGDPHGRPAEPTVTLDQLPAVDPADTTWHAEGACRGMDPAIWYPNGETAHAAKKQIARAQAICETCPVRLTCLAWALHHQEPDGVWGGLKSSARRKLAETEGAACVG